MKTTILLRQVTIDDDVRKLIEKKIKKLDKFFLDNAEAFVTLSKKREKEILELTITAAGSLFRSEVEGPSTSLRKMEPDAVMVSSKISSSLFLLSFTVASAFSRKNLSSFLIFFSINARTSSPMVTCLRRIVVFIE